MFSRPRRRRAARTIACALLTTIVATATLAVARAEGPAGPSRDSLRAEGARRNDALVKQGFNLTQRIDLQGGAGKQPVRIEVFVPPADDPHQVRVWAAVSGGALSLRMTTATGATPIQWTGSSIDTSLVLAIPTGKCVFEIDRARVEGGYAVLGVKGPVIARCDVDLGLARERPARPEHGFSWPYLLYIPRQGNATHLLVAPNNTGFATGDIEFIRVSGSCELARQTELADRLGTPLLVPLFPRPPLPDGNNLYLHALARASLTTKTPALERVDRQLIAMIDDARAWLAHAGRTVSPRVLLTGFSASGSFVDRFSMLHPERALAVACGSPGGWPIAPVATDSGATLTYPVGVADVKALTGATPDAKALAQVKWFLFLGDQDDNDAVPFRDSFSVADSALVFRRYGPTPVSRWDAARRLYESRRLDARFKLYPGVAHQVTPGMLADIEAFFSEALKSAE